MLARRILGQPRRLTSCWRLVGTREGARVGDSTARWEWEDDKRPGQWAKRKLALSIGYLGTPYHGLQKTRTRPVTESVLDVPAAVAAALKAKDLPTVELALEKALHAAGCITTSNLGDLDRLGWSRMARTDKGVHAARSIVTAKLRVPVEPTPAAAALARGHKSHYDGSALTRVAPGALEALRTSINAHLPPDVRCWGVAVTPGSFRAREGCSWREYEYVFPASVLDVDDNGSSSSSSSSSGGDEEAKKSTDAGSKAGKAARRAARLVALQGALSQFEGVHTWHNFTKAGALLLGGGSHRDHVLQSDADHGEELSLVSRSATPPQSPSTPHQGASSSTPRGALSDNDLFAALDQREFSSNGLNEEVNAEKKKAVSDDDGEGDDDDEDGGSGVTSSETIHEWAVKELTFQASRDQTKEKMLSSGPAVFRIIHKCFAYEEPMVVNGVPLVRIRVRGTSFLYNQIRYMVGAAVAVARGVLPSWHLDAALQAPFAVPVPLAPPTGLLLVDAGFGSYAKAHVCYTSSPSPMSGNGHDGIGSNSSKTTLKKHPNSLMDHERVSPFCLKALRAHGAKVGPTPEEEKEGDRDQELSFRSQSQPNHRKGDHHSLSSSQRRLSDRKHFVDGNEGLPVVELMESSAYAETIQWQDDVIYPHIVDQWGLSAAAESNNDNSTGNAENNNHSNSKQGTITTVSRSELERWRVNEARVVAYSQLLQDPMRCEGTDNNREHGIGLVKDETVKNIESAFIASKSNISSSNSSTSPSSAISISGLEARWLRTKQELATKQASSDAKGAQRRETALRRAAIRQQAGLYPWASSPSSSSSKDRQPKLQRQARGQKGNLRGRGQGGNGGSSSGSRAENSVENGDGAAGAIDASTASDVYPVDVNDVLPRRFGPAVSQHFRIPPAGSDPAAARDLHALKLAMANALLMGDVAEAAADLGLSPGTASQKAEASASEMAPPSTKAKEETKQVNSKTEGSFTEANLFPATTDATQESDALALAAALPMDVLLEYMETNFTLNGRSR